MNAIINEIPPNIVLGLNGGSSVGIPVVVEKYKGSP
jgi:hypothetical protein